MNTPVKLRAYREVTWTAEIDAAIGTDTDSAIGRRFGISPRSILVRRRKLGLQQERKTAPRWTRTMEKLLGGMPDTEVAKKLEIDVYWVRKRRAELQIAAYEPPELPSAEEDTREELKLTKERIALLGKHSDGERARPSAGTTMERASESCPVQTRRIEDRTVCIYHASLDGSGDRTLGDML